MHRQELHPQTPQVVAVSDKVIIKIIAAFILVWAYMFFPESETLHYPFKYDSQGLSWQAYADYLFTRIAIILLVWCVLDLSPKFREYIFILLFLWVGYLVDYLLCYNQPYAHWHYIPVCYGLLAGSAMIFIFLYKVLTE